MTQSSTRRRTALEALSEDDWLLEEDALARDALARNSDEALLGERLPEHRPEYC